MSDPGYAAAEAAWGDHEPEPVTWSSGDWSFERRGDELANISFGGSIALRSIRAVARDRNWDTVPATVTRVSEKASSLTVELRLFGLGADFSGFLRFAAERDTVRVALELTSATDFDRNRVGLIVLHPPDLAGAHLRIKHPGGSVDETSFPVAISPHQPAFDIAGLSWHHDGREVTMVLEGDVFEMEDQRNWTDASFKTYSTPLSDPFPVHISAGTTIRQSLTIAIRRVADTVVGHAEAGVVFGAPSHSMPAVGVGASTGPDPIAPTSAPAAFVLVELVTSSANWRPALVRAAGEAGDALLDVRIVADDADAVADAVAELRSLRNGGVEIVRVGVFSSTSHLSETTLWEMLCSVSSDCDWELVGGVRSHFTELNRGHHLLPESVPALTFSSTPQMHATDRYQLVEAIGMQRLTAEQAVRISAGRPVHIGPITLRSRFNAVATTPPTPEGPDIQAGYGPQHLPAATDPRQRSAALGAWTIAAAAAFAVPGVASLAFFESSGERGLADTDSRYPAGVAVGWLDSLRGRPVLTVSGLPPLISALAVADDHGATILASNLAALPASIDMELGEYRRRVELGAFGIARIDLTKTETTEE